MHLPYELVEYKYLLKFNPQKCKLMCIGQSGSAHRLQRVLFATRMWAMPNLMVALPNIGGALCSTPQSLADAHY